MTDILDATQAREAGNSDVAHTATTMLSHWCEPERMRTLTHEIITASPMEAHAEGDALAMVAARFRVNGDWKAPAGYDDDTTPFHNPGLEASAVAYGEKVVAALNRAIGADPSLIQARGHLVTQYGPSMMSPIYQVELHSSLVDTPDDLRAMMKESRARVKLALERQAKTQEKD